MLSVATRIPVAGCWRDAGILSAGKLAGEKKAET
jgi:hypothetical protein